MIRVVILDCCWLVDGFELVEIGNRKRIAVVMPDFQTPVFVCNFGLDFPTVKTYHCHDQLDNVLSFVLI